MPALSNLSIAPASNCSLEQNLATVGADIRRRPQVILGTTRNARRTRGIDLADAGRVLTDRCPGGLDMDIVQPVAGGQDALGDDVRSVKPAEPGFAGLRQEYLAQLRHQGVGRFRTPGKVRKARIAGEILPFDRGAQALVLRLVDQRDHDPAIAGLIGARRYIERAWRAALQHKFRGLVAEHAAVDCARLTSIQRPVPTVRGRTTRWRWPGTRKPPWRRRIWYGRPGAESCRCRG